MLALIQFQRLTRTDYLVTFPMMFENGVSVMTERVQKKHLEKLVSGMTEIADKVAKALRQPVPRKRKGRGMDPRHASILRVLDGGKP
jgi:hypothetical protein